MIQLEPVSSNESNSSSYKFISSTYFSDILLNKRIEFPFSTLEGVDPTNLFETIVQSFAIPGIPNKIQVYKERL